jgi:flagellar hook-associated protein 1 FlgK
MSAGQGIIDLSGAVPASTPTQGAGMQPGNTLTISVKDLKGVPKNIILVASNVSPLPKVPADQTDDSSAITVAFDISKGPSNYKKAIQDALNGLTKDNPNIPPLDVQASSSSNSSAAANASGAVLAITSKQVSAPVLGVTATVTLPISLKDLNTGNPSLALFVDSTNNALYTGYFDSGSQLTGFAQRIAVNTNLSGNTAALTATASSSTIASGARAQQLFSALTSTQQTFSSSSGIGGVSAPYSATVVGFAQDIISSQGAAATNATALDETQQTAFSTAQSRFASRAGVNIDQEMSNLIALQTAYGANARILTAARDMLNQLLQI